MALAMSRPSFRPRGYGALWALLGALVAGLPLYYAYVTLQLEWHDHGTVYNMLRNVFERGYLHYYDRDFDYLNVHFTPFLYLLAALVRPVDTLLFFLTLHVAALIVAAYALFLITREATGSEPTAVLVSLAFLLSPYTMAANLYTHYDVFMLTTLLSFQYLLSKGRVVPSVALLLLALTIKEDVWLYACCLILSQARGSNKKAPALCLLIGLGYAALVVGSVWPALYPDRDNVFQLIYAQGRTKLDVGLFFLSHPLTTSLKLVTGPGLGFLSSLLFLPLFAPVRSLLALPILYLWVNSTSVERSSLAFYYSIPSLLLFAPLLPAALLNLRRLLVKLVPGPAAAYVTRWCLPLAAGLLLLTSAVRNVFLPDGLERSPSVRSVLADEQRFGEGYREHHRVGWDILLNRIPLGRSVITHFTLASYVTGRHETYLFFKDGRSLENGTLRPDYVLYDLKSRYPLLGPRRMKELHEWTTTCPDYTLIYSKDGYFLYGLMVRRETRGDEHQVS